MSIRNEIRREMSRQPQVAGEIEKNIARIKAQAIENAFANHRGKNSKGVLSLTTRVGTKVDLALVSYKEDKSGNSFVDIYIQPSERGRDSHFKIYNPPTLVYDAQGSITVRGRKYREDPIGAIAEVIAKYGGGRR